MTHPFLPYARQQIDRDDIAAVNAVLESDFLTTGPVINSFEDKLSELTGDSFAVSCSSGTAALHLAAAALALKPGDKVIVPSITFLATANAVRYTGADVVFADVDPDNGLMTPAHLESALAIGGDQVKAVFPVHLAGQCADMKTISEIAKHRQLAIVEDACHAIGATYSKNTNDKNQAVGSCNYGDMAVFSFHPVKTITMGEGGAITTQNENLLHRLRLLRNHGITREESAFVQSNLARGEDEETNSWFYEMQDIGFNYRASDIHCALGLSQLKKLELRVQRRRDLVKLYDNLLATHAPLIKPITRAQGSNPAWHLYSVLIDFETAGLSRQKFMMELRERGIGSQVHYIPVHRQPYYQHLYGEIDLPDADAYYSRTLSLPLFSQMEDGDVERVVEAISQIL